MYTCTNPNVAAELKNKTHKNVSKLTIWPLSIQSGRNLTNGYMHKSQRSPTTKKQNSKKCSQTFEVLISKSVLKKDPQKLKRKEKRRERKKEVGGENKRLPIKSSSLLLFILKRNVSSLECIFRGDVPSLWLISFRSVRSYNVPPSLVLLSHSPRVMHMLRVKLGPPSLEK